MTDAIVRLYETEQQARDAYAKLKQEGFPDNRIFLVASSPATAVTADGEEAEAGDAAAATQAAAELDKARLDMAAAALAAGTVMSTNARVYLDGLRQGRSLVVCDAPFGSARLAIHLMDSFGPVDLGPLPSADTVRQERQRATSGTPLSAALGLPVLSRKYDPAPLSDTLGVAVLSSGRSGFSRFSELTSPGFSFSSMFGLKLLSTGGATPLSSKLGLKVLLADKTGRRTSLGLPLLARQAAPLSALVGAPLLLNSQTDPAPRGGWSLWRNRPAPFSSLFALPLLSHGRSPISGMFQELTSAEFSLSSKLGLSLLTRKPGPVLPFKTIIPHRSGRQWSFGLPLLWNNPAPLSSALGLPTKSL